jgi:signal transduction histidine kinase
MLLAAVAVAALLGAAFERTLLGAFDRRLSDELLTIAGQVTADGGGQARMRGEPLDTRYARVFSGHYWTVTAAGRDFRSRSLWDARLPAAKGLHGGNGGSIDYGTLTGPLGQTLRAASRDIDVAGVEGPVRISVASDVGDTLEEIERFRLQAGIAGALVAAALLLVLALQTGFGLRPLREIRQALEALRRGDTRKLDNAGFPREIRPLAEELNAVLVHHERMVERARAGAGDLAHALKTPLSVMLAAAERTDPDLGAVVREQAAKIRHDVERHLAISTPADRQSRTHVAEVASSLVELLATLYTQRGLVIDVEIDKRLVFHGSRADLGDMLGNLMDNACKWARHRIRVLARAGDAALHISVIDDGPGIADADVATAMRRGARLDERTPGSGLGLSITAALAASYDGALQLEANTPAGLHASLSLPGGRAE